MLEDVLRMSDTAVDEMRQQIAKELDMVISKGVGYAQMVEMELQGIHKMVLELQLVLMMLLNLTVTVQWMTLQKLKLNRRWVLRNKQKVVQLHLLHRQKRQKREINNE